MTFDKAKYQQLLRAYHKALKASADTFNFDGQDILVSYAKYLIEYLKERIVKD